MKTYKPIQFCVVVDGVEFDGMEAKENKPILLIRQIVGWVFKWNWITGFSWKYIEEPDNGIYKCGAGVW